MPGVQLRVFIYRRYLPEVARHQTLLHVRLHATCGVYAYRRQRPRIAFLLVVPPCVNHGAELRRVKGVEVGETHADHADREPC